MAIAHYYQVEKQTLGVNIPIEYQPYNPIIRFWKAITIPGDASGGTISCAFLQKAANDIDPYYHIISRIDVATDDLTITNCYLFILNNHFIEGLPNRCGWKHIFSDTVIPAASQIDSQYMQPIYLGKSIPAGTGAMALVTDTNVNGKDYYFFISGYSFGRPPLTNKLPIM